MNVIVVKPRSIIEFLLLLISVLIHGICESGSSRDGQYAFILPSLSRK